MNPKYVVLALVLAILIPPIAKLALRLAGRGDPPVFALSLLVSLGLNVILVLLPGFRDTGPFYMAFVMLLAQLISVVGVATGILLTMIATALWQKRSSRGT